VQGIKLNHASGPNYYLAVGFEKEITGKQISNLMAEDGSTEKVNKIK
jgi:hypothetical protein